MWELQRGLVDALQVTCESLIHDVEHEILDSEGLIGTIEGKPPVRAEYVDRFFDPEVPVEDAFRFMPPVKEAEEQAHTIIDLLQLQSRRLASIEDELSAARRALDERRIIERAKGILMARFDLTEDEAYKKMRKTSMDKNLRLVEVAESVQALVSFPGEPFQVEEMLQSGDASPANAPPNCVLCIPAGRSVSQRITK